MKKDLMESIAQYGKIIIESEILGDKKSMYINTFPEELQEIDYNLPRLSLDKFCFKMFSSYYCPNISNLHSA